MDVPRHIYNNHGGYTLIEVLVVIAIGVVFFTLTAIGWSSIGKYIRMEEVQQRVVSLVQQARELTLARSGGYNYGIHCGPTSVTLFTAPTYVFGAVSNTVYAIPSSFTVVECFVVGQTTGDITFAFFTGELATQSGSSGPVGGSIKIQAVGQPTLQRRITIVPSGYVESFNN